MGGAFRLRSATGIIALVTAAVSILVFALADADTAALVGGFVPARFSGLLTLTPAVPALLTPFSAALLHGSFLHLALNLLMLAFVGSQVERILGAGVRWSSPLNRAGTNPPISAAVSASASTNTRIDTAAVTSAMMPVALLRRNAPPMVR